MAKWEHEGYCPNNTICRKLWEGNFDSRLIGLWDVFGSVVVYATEEENETPIDVDTCNKVFTEDPLAYSLLAAIIKKAAQPEKVKIHQIHNGASNKQMLVDIMETMKKLEAANPELVVAAGSNFAVLLSNAGYGIDVWIWDLLSLI